MGLALWFTGGPKGWAETMNGINELQEQIELLVARVAFLEQKQDPAVMDTLAQATRWGMEPEHTGYNMFSWEEYEPCRLVWTMSTNEYTKHSPKFRRYDTLLKLQEAITYRKAAKYDKCLSEGKCTSRRSK
jgi:hypothetical protein